MPGAGAGILVLDGATGTELARRGVDTRGPLFGAGCLAGVLSAGGAPGGAGTSAGAEAGASAAGGAGAGGAALLEIHRAYVEAGAQVITAFTFRTNARALGRAGLDPRASTALSRAAVAIAREASGGRARVAGSIAPVEDCYRPELSPPRAEALREHGPFARALADAGCDLLLVETVCARDEGLAAVEAAASTGLPVWVSAMAAPFRSGDPAEPARLLDESSLVGFLTAAREAGAEAALLNCVPCDTIDRALAAAPAAGFAAFGAYAHQGEVDPLLAWPAAPVLSPGEYRTRAAVWIARGASIVGGCCGTTPAHIEALRELSHGGQPGRTS